MCKKNFSKTIHLVIASYPRVCTELAEASFFVYKHVLQLIYIAIFLVLLKIQFCKKRNFWAILSPKKVTKS